MRCGGWAWRRTWLLSHPQISGGVLASVCQPLLDVRLLDSGDWNMQTTPHLRQLLERAAPMRDAHTLVRLLALTHALLKLNTLSGQSFRCLDLVECSLKDASAVAAIDRQLTALRAGPAARSASEGWQRGCTPWRCMCASYVHVQLCWPTAQACRAASSPAPTSRLRSSWRSCCPRTPTATSSSVARLRCLAPAAVPCFAPGAAACSMPGSRATWP